MALRHANAQQLLSNEIEKYTHRIAEHLGNMEGMGDRLTEIKAMILAQPEIYDDDDIVWIDEQLAIIKHGMERLAARYT